jgi:hypothetical protein
LTAALAIAGCSGDKTRPDYPDHCFGCGIESEPPSAGNQGPGYAFGFDPQLNRALINDLGPAEEAKEIGQALNAGYSVANLQVAFGYSIQWKQLKHNHENIYPNSHITQPIVFGDGVYGFVVGAWTGSMAGPAAKHKVGITVFRTELPLTPLTVNGEPARHPHIGPAVVQLVLPPQPRRNPGACVMEVPGTIHDQQVATLPIGDQAVNEGCCRPSASY